MSMVPVRPSGIEPVALSAFARLPNGRFLEEFYALHDAVTRSS